MAKHKTKPHKAKLPVAILQSPSQKKPRYERGPDPNYAFPSWRIGMLEMVDPFGWHELGKEKLEWVRQKLAYFESMTWNEILVKHKHQNHSVPIDQLCKEARDRLIQIGQDDIEDLVSLHLAGTERVWGIRDGETLRVLWWDPKHRVCPTPKKHT